MDKLLNEIFEGLLRRCSFDDEKLSSLLQDVNHERPLEPPSFSEMIWDGLYRSLDDPYGQ